jgi:hypothetical protein
MKANIPTKFPIPPYPMIFVKASGTEPFHYFLSSRWSDSNSNQPIDALAGPFEDVPIHREAAALDYEAS